MGHGSKTNIDQGILDIDKNFINELYAIMDTTTLSFNESDILIKLFKKRPGNDSIPSDYNTMRKGFQKHVTASIPSYILKNILISLCKRHSSFCLFSKTCFGLICKGSNALKFGLDMAKSLSSLKIRRCN